MDSDRGARRSSPTPILDAVRRGGRFVAERARFVRVEIPRIPAYAEALAQADPPPPTYDVDRHFRGSPEETAAYVITLDAVNFGSGFFPHLAKRPGMSGYFTIASGLADRFRRSGPLTPRSLAAIDPPACAELFGQSLADPAIAELMGWFARAWNDLGRELLRRFGGSFLALIDAAGESADRLVAILSAGQPLFRDVARYQGRSIPLYKRAQITASDLALAFAGSGPGAFADLDRLTAFADNLVPHVLRIDGVLRYHPDLLGRIERGNLLPPGSIEEVEIRACAVDAVERIANRLRQIGRPVPARVIDGLLWNLGQGPEYKSEPRHRTRSPYY